MQLALMFMLPCTTRVFVSASQIYHGRVTHQLTQWGIIQNLCQHACAMEAGGSTGRESAVCMSVFKPPATIPGPM